VGNVREGAGELGRNLELLRVCDGLSLFVCLNEPGGDAYSPPYPGGFKFGGESYRPIWEDRATPRLEPNPLFRSFEDAIPYLSVGKDRRLLGDGALELRVVTT
jgi:hypothetical protein